MSRSVQENAEAAHILVVDDDRRIRGLLSRFLVNEGYRVSSAANAAEASSRLSELLVDLIVLDVMMPGEDGVAFATRLRADSSPLSDAPILMLTARSEPKSRITGLEAGVDDYLGKPFEPRELALRIASILRRTRAPGRDLRRARIANFGGFSFSPDSGLLLRGESPCRSRRASASCSARSREAMSYRGARSRCAPARRNQTKEASTSRLRAYAARSTTRRISSKPCADRAIGSSWTPRAETLAKRDPPHDHGDPRDHRRAAPLVAPHGRLAAQAHAQGPLCPRLADLDSADRAAAVRCRLCLHAAALGSDHEPAFRGGRPRHGGDRRALPQLPAGRGPPDSDPHRRRGSGREAHRQAEGAAAAVDAAKLLLSARPRPAARARTPAQIPILDRHLEQPFRHDRRAARRRRSRTRHDANAGLRLQLTHILHLDDARLGSDLGDRHDLFAQPDSPDPASRQSGGGVRQRSRCALPAERRARGAGGGSGLPGDEASRRTRDRSAHDHAQRRLARSAHDHHALQAVALASRQDGGHDRAAQGRRRDGGDAGGLSRLRARRWRRGAGEDGRRGDPQRPAGRYAEDGHRRSGSRSRAIRR